MEFLNKKDILLTIESLKNYLGKSQFHPAICINGYLVKDSLSDKAINIVAKNSLDLSLAIKDLNSNFNSLQLALVYLELRNNGFLEKLNIIKEDFFSDLLKTYNYNFSSILLQTTEHLNSLPSSFLFWCLDKKVQLSHLEVLLTKKNHPYLDLIPEKNFSHAQGIQFLELSVELLLMNIDLNISQIKNEKPEEILSYLKKLRYPKTFEYSELKQHELKAIASDFLRHITMQPVSDTLSLNLNFNIKSLQDIKKLELNLEKIKSVYKNDLN